MRHFLLQLEQWTGDGPDYQCRPITVIAHIFQGYDSYPVTNTLHRLAIQLTQVRNGGKVLELTCLQSVRFINSMSFFQMPLAKFPATFGLTELHKGYLPHLFNTPEHQTYVGVLPDLEHYMPDNMTPSARKALIAWHHDLTQQNFKFHFQKELLAYCQSDVQFLKQGCLIFRRDFQEKAGFCPFEQMTIASACNCYLRRRCLEPNTIAIEPPQGLAVAQLRRSSATSRHRTVPDVLSRIPTTVISPWLTFMPSTKPKSMPYNAKATM